MKYLLTIAASLIVFLTPAIGFSQSNVLLLSSVCATDIEFAETMDNYGEQPLARGMSIRPIDNVRDRLLVIFINPTSRSWTIAEKIAEGIVCVVAMGQEFEPLDAKGKPMENKFDKNQQEKKLH